MADRDQMGRFVKGRKSTPGPGRPKRTTEAEYLETTIGRVTLDQWAKVVDKALGDATSGDGPTSAAARKWLSEYLMGKPPQVLELRGSETHLLAELIRLANQIGKTPGDLFEAMIAELALMTDEVGDDE